MIISAIIPAYNEGNTIAGVVDIVGKVGAVHEIIVVSDGSDDNTAFTARRCGAKVVELPRNMGKGAAIKAGLDRCKGDVILFLDADLVGLTVEHVESLLKPVVGDKADMAVGIFSNGRLTTDFAHKVSPHLSGQRVVRKTILDKISNMDITGYGIEMALTAYAEKNDIRVKEVTLPDLTHVMKEEKFGFIRGFGKRIKMYWEVYRGLRLSKKPQP